MYKDIEIETSHKYLSKVISQLEEPICILGGWAVFFLVEKGYKAQTGRIYLGSRDIDIGFNSIEPFKQTSKVLESGLNFEFLSFRFFKNVNAETGKDLTAAEAKSLPRHMLFPIYIDPVFSFTDGKLKKQLGFSPIDEPLLKYVFDDRKYGKEAREFGKNVIIPAPEILLAMKIHSVVGRDKKHKRQKDVCDIVSLCLFSEMPINDIIKKSRDLFSKDKFKQFKDMNFKDEIIKSSNMLGIESNILESIIDKVKER